MTHRVNIVLLIVGICCSFLFFYNSDFLWWALLLTISVFFVILSFGVIAIRMNYFVKAISTIQPPEILLTFDDGPDPVNTPQILDALKTHGIHAVFFLIGEKAKANPNIVKRILDEGHQLGNHTYRHPVFFALFSVRKVQTEIALWQDFMQREFTVTSDYFRPPIGYTNPNIARVVRNKKLVLVGWSKRSFDSVLKNPIQLKKRVIRITKPGDIVLFHDNLPQTAAMIPAYLKELKENGAIFADPKSLKITE